MKIPYGLFTILFILSWFAAVPHHAAGNEPAVCQEDQARKSAEDFVREARKLEGMGRKVEAQNLYYKALELDPDNEAAHKGLGHVRFTPEKHLSSYAEYKDHMFLAERLEPFTERNGAWLSEEVLEALKHDWNALRPELDREVEKNLNDPYLIRINRYQKQMLIRPFYQEIMRTRTFEVSDKARPFALFIQHDRSRREDYPARVAAFITPALKDLHALFEKEFVTPYKLKKRPGFDAMVLWALNSHGEYDNQVRRLGDSMLPPSMYAHYSPRLEEAITYWDPDAKNLILNCILHECVHFLCDAYTPEGIRGISSFWIVEGLAEYLGTASRTAPSAPMQFMGENRHRIAEFINGLKALDGRWPLPIEVILGAEDMAHLLVMAEEIHRRESRLQNIDLVSWFYSASYCLCRHLDQQRHQAFRDYLEKDLRGEGGLERFASLVQMDSPVDLAWEITTHFASPYVSKRPPVRAKTREETAKSDEKGSSKSERKVPDQPPPPLSREELARLVESHPEPVIARACLQGLFFAQGPKETVSFLEEILAPDGAAALAAELKQDMEMMRDLHASLDRLFPDMAREGDFHRLLESREKYRIKTCEGSKLTLLDENGAEKTVSLGDLDLKQFALAVRREPKRKRDPRIRIMLGCTMMLKGLSNEAYSELRRAGEEGKDMVPLCNAYAEAAEHLGVIEVLGCGGEDREVPGCEMIERSMARAASSPLVSQFRDRLKSAAAFAIARDIPKAELIRARFTGECALDPDRRWLSLKYPPLDPGLLGDWNQVYPDCVAAMRDQVRERFSTFPEKGSISVKKDSFSMVGDTILVSGILFDGDVSFNFEGLLTGGEQQFYMVAGIGQQNGKGALFSQGFHSLEIVDYENPGAVPDGLEVKDYKLYVNTTYKFRIRREGDAITCTVNKDKTASGSYPGLKEGHVFLWVAGKSPYHIKSLELEGRVSEQWMEEAFQAAVEARVASLFKD